MILRKVSAKNFKSLKDLDLSLQQLNILVGPNGSGKTNFLELFKFAIMCMHPAVPPYPFLPWWGYNNIVWKGKEELPISFGFNFVIESYEVSYEATISGTGGQFSIITETLNIKGILECARNYNKITLNYNSEFIEQIKKTYSELEKTFPRINPAEPIMIDNLKSQTIEGIKPSMSLMNYLSGWGATYTQDMKYAIGRTNVPQFDPQPSKNLAFISPVIKVQHGLSPIFPISSHFFQGVNDVILIRQTNYSVIRQPTPFVGAPVNIQENGEGLVNLLFYWFNTKGGRLPERIESALRELFPNWQLVFEPTSDGRVMMNVKENDMILKPTSIPDGLYRLLIILTAVELKPKVLLIDEVETSFHLKIIEYLMSTFKTSETTVILTTHSPLVVDLVQLEDLIVLEKEQDETTIHRIKDPEVLRKKLQESGISNSESWLYGKL